MKKIFITGSSGMVGHNIIDELKKFDYEIIAPTHQELDLLNQYALQEYLSIHRPDIIIHCAGKVGGIQANIANPVDFLYINMQIGMNIIREAFNLGISKFLNLASSCMYPANLDIPLKEYMILTGALESTNEGYALAKCAATRLCQFISKNNHGFQYKTLIPCNLYGKYDKFDKNKSHMLAAIIRKIDYAKEHSLSEVTIWGTGSARREFMYVEDLALLVASVCRNFDELPDIMNAGIGYDFTINEYYEIAANIIGYDGNFIHDLSKPEGMQRKLLDISLQTKFGFTPVHTLKEGIKKTYEWYKTI